MKILYLENTLKYFESVGYLTQGEIVELAQNGLFKQSKSDDNLRYFVMKYDDNEQVVNLNNQ